MFDIMSREMRLDAPNVGDWTECNIKILVFHPRAFTYHPRAVDSRNPQHESDRAQ